VRIVLDLQGAQAPSTRERGIGRYSLGLAEAIARGRGDHDVHLVLNGAFPETIAPIRSRFANLVSRDRIHVFDVLDPVPDQPDHPARIASEMCREAFLARLDPDVVHVSTLIEGMRGNAISSIGRLGLDLPTAVTFYDAIPLIYRSRYLGTAEAARWYDHRIRQLRRADLLLAISRSSAREAVEHMSIEPARVANIGAAADPAFHPRILDEEERLSLLSRHGIRHPFVMYTGGLDFRKNIEGLLAGFAALPRGIKAEHQLVIAGACGAKEKAQLLELARRIGLGGSSVAITGALENSELASLYSLAKVFVFPSLHEGFGLPILEAMRCGAAVLGSDCSSMPEVIGTDDALFDPREPRAIRDSLMRVLTDEAELERLKRHSARQAEKFSWEAVGERAIVALEDLNRRRRSQTAPGIRSGAKRRLAYVSPIPPSRSGIATYSRDLLPCLADFYEIDVVVERDQAGTGLPGVSKVIEAPVFLEQAGRYDRVLYHFGNSEFHDYMVPLIQAVPGIVVLHDVYLGGLIRHRAIREGQEKQWLRALYENHGAAAVLHCSQPAARHEAASTYPCCSTIVDHSLGLIVHSAYARSLASEWLTPDWMRRISQIPLAHPAPVVTDRVEARQRLGLPPEAWILCSFGLMGPTKRNLDILSAWNQSNAFADGKSVLIFVGARATGDYGDAVEQEIARLGLEARVRITGWTDDQDYRDYLGACDAAVQLRSDSRGETSLALLDALSSGVPTIANANGSVADLPPSILSLLPDRFEQAQLRDAVDALYTSRERAQAMGEAARRQMASEHSPREVAQLHHEQIERFYGRSADLVRALEPNAAALPAEDAARLAQIASRSTQLPASRTIYLDVSELAEPSTPDSRRRFLSDAVREVARTIPRHMRLELIRYDDDLGLYVKAHRSCAALFGLSRPLLPDEPFDFYFEDILLCLDSRQEAVSLRERLLDRLYAAGLRILFLIDDLRDPGLEQAAPQSISAIFVDWLSILGRSSGALCSSESLADELSTCLGETGLEQRPFSLHWVRSGADGRREAGEWADAVRELVDQLTSSAGSGNHAQEGRPPDLFVPGETELLQQSSDAPGPIG
jgi:glycosyltransferase involved in cell wall biosynthesis